MAGPFELALSQFAKKAGENADAAVKNVVLEIGARLVVRSPVDEGRFHANWFYSEGSASTGSTDATIPVVNGLADLNSKAAGRVHYLTNNSPQGLVIEFGGYPNPPKKGTGRTINGFSTQAPQGVVGLTALEFSEIVDQAVPAVNR